MAGGFGPSFEVMRRARPPTRVSNACERCRRQKQRVRATHGEDIETHCRSATISDHVRTAYMLVLNARKQTMAPQPSM